jgi:putative phosphoesterase
MRIGIISDTHDQQARTLAAVQLLKANRVEVLFHCGDLIEPEMVATCADLPAYFVFGNNDVDRVPEIRKAISVFKDAVCLEWGGEVKLDGKRLAMTHGHLDTDVRRLLASEPDYMFSGHSHVAADWRQGKTRRINPGALHRARQFTVALLELQNDDLRFLTVPR